MKRNITQITFVLGILLVIGLLVSGCGRNEAQELPAADAPTEALEAIHTRLAELEAREAAPEPLPEPEPRLVTVRLAAMTELPIEFLDSASSETSLAGEPVRARITADIVEDGLIVIPAGSEVWGTVSEAVPQKKIGGQARLAIAFERIERPDGYSAAIQASFEAAGKKQKKKDAATIGGSAAGGAILGRILTKDRSKGTAIGAVLGAAIGTAIASENKGDPVVIEPGAPALIQLELPVHVAVDDPQTSTLVARN